MSLISNLKDLWDNYLERLSKQNKELFPDGRPSCCAGKQAPQPVPGKGQEAQPPKKPQ